ncbi:AMP-binding protein [Brevibacillus daliensis]|uniref:AMP-binding protein n=1 Tax=Brevibacillus daliensis TaxID=2892995 RepID=UPI001E2B347C|nr:AMP-binding protein [Brevibacillus daliensis]
MITSVIKGITNTVYQVEIEGLERLDFSKPVILAPNHVSLLDAVLLASNLPKEVCFVVNTDVAKKYASLMSQRKIITIDPFNSYSIRKILREVRNGVPLVLFPEGRVTTTGGLMKVYSGLGYIAYRTGASIYPISLVGPERSPFSYLKGKWKKRLFPKVKIRIGESYQIEDDRTISRRQLKEQASHTVYRKMKDELFITKHRKHVQLFDEMLEAGKKNGFSMTICEELTQSLTYKKMALTAYALGESIRDVLPNEQRIGTLLPTSMGHMVTLFAMFYAGKTPALLNFSMGTKTIMETCETAGVKVVLTSKVFIEKGNLHAMISELSKHVQFIYLEDIKERITTGTKAKAFFHYLTKQQAYKNDQTENEIILFTSGSESKPKGVVLTHSNIFNNIQQVLTMIDITSQDKLLNALPMFHSFGMTVGTILPVISGIPVFCYPSPLHYKVIPEIAYDRDCTILFGTSTFLAGYARVAKPYDFYKMRYVIAGAEKLKDDVRQLWMDKFGIRVLEGYGTTEASPILALNTPLMNKKGSVGQLLPGIAYQLEEMEGIAEGGNLLVDGPNIMKGYLFHDQGFQPRTGYYDCGDIVTIDKEGYVSIVARKKRFAKIAGEMVSLNLVEQLASEFIQDSGVATVTASDKRKGEKVVLYTQAPIVLRDLKEYIVAKGFSPLLVPSKIEQIKQLPLLGSGKVDYVTLKELATEE